MTPEERDAARAAHAAEIRAVVERTQARAIMGRERFDACAELVSKRPAAAEADAWFLLALVVREHDGDKLHPPDWPRDRDHWLEGLRRAIRRNFQTSPTWRDAMLSDVERLGTYPSKPGPIDFRAATRANLWSKTRRSLGGSKPGDIGRPRAPHLRTAFDGLRKLGFTIDETKKLFRVLGVTATYPAKRKAHRRTCNCEQCFERRSKA